MSRLAMLSAAALTTQIACAPVRLVTMVPVNGPLSEQRPVPVLQLKAEGITGNSGRVTMVMPGGELCEGRWSSAAGAGLAYGSASLLSEYGSAYLSGFSISTGHGQNPGQALVVCPSGRVLQIEFVSGAGTGNGFGIAKDNEENIYRLVF